MSSIARPFLTSYPLSESEVRLVDSSEPASANTPPGTSQAGGKIPYRSQMSTRERNTVLISLLAVPVLLFLGLRVRQWWKRRVERRFCKKRHLLKLYNRNGCFNMDSLDEKEYHGETGRLQKVVLVIMDFWRPRHWALLWLDKRENRRRLKMERRRLKMERRRLKMERRRLKMEKRRQMEECRFRADPVVDRHWPWNFPDGVSDIRIVGVYGANAGVTSKEPEPGEGPDEKELANMYERQAEEVPELFAELFESLSEEELANMLATQAEALRRLVPPERPVTVAPERHDGQSTPSTITSDEAVATYQGRKSFETSQAFNKRRKTSRTWPKNTSLPAPTHGRLSSRIQKKARSSVSAEP
ncbi:hypothetical protein LTR67_010832 [Exophiala xenobiotica]